MAYRSSSSTSLGSATSVVINVPASVAADDIVVVCIYIENNTKTITPPSGFTQKYGPDTFTAQHHTYWFWKRLTGADTGTYTFSWSGAEPSQGIAIAFSGRITSGDPFDASSSGSASGSPANFQNISVTAAANADAMAMYSTWATGTLTAPGGFTTRQNVGEVAAVTQDNVSGGTLNANGASWSTGSDGLINRLATLLVATAGFPIPSMAAAACQQPPDFQPQTFQSVSY